MQSSTNHTGFRRVGFRPLAVVTIAATLALSSGVMAANAAAGDESHATGTFLSGSLTTGLTPSELLELGSASVDNDGTQPTQTESNALNATVLGLGLDVPGGLQVGVDYTAVDVGAVSSFAQAEANGSSLGASGLVGDDGSIGVGAPGTGVPGPFVFDLSDVLGTALGSELTNLSLEVGAASARASSTTGAAPVGSYEIEDTYLVIESATLGEVASTITSSVADLQALLDGLDGIGGTLALAVGGTVSSATVSADLAASITGLLSPRGVGDAVSIDPASGEIFVDLEQITPGGLNGRDPNTLILTSTELEAIRLGVEDLLADIVDEVSAAVESAIADAAVSITADVVGADVSVTGTLSQVAAGTATVTVDPVDPIAALAVSNALTVPALAIIDDAFDAFLAGLDADVLDEVATELDSALLALENVLTLTVNVQQPSPPVAGQLFTETALRLTLLPTVAVTGLSELNIASASVGPNAVDVAPVITNIDPPSGPETGGTLVTIDGTGFVGTTAVTFDGIAGTLVSVTDTQITVNTPAHVPATVPVVIQHPSGPSLPGQFTFTPVISADDIDPGFGPTAGGTAVTIFGSCFTGATGVTFDGVAGTSFVVVSDTEITVVTPPHAIGVVPVVVLGSTACNGDATVPGGFTYVSPAAPTVLSITPDNGPQAGGTSVVITGSGFTGATGVTFGGTPATSVVVVSDTQITAVTPAHAPGLVGVIVLHPDENSGPLDFVFTPSTTVTSVDPGSGPEAGGTTVTITGTCFTGATAVLFGGTPATSFTVVSDTVITAITPRGTGTVDVTIIGSTACGSGGADDAFRYVASLATTGSSIAPILAVAVSLLLVGLMLLAYRLRKRTA